ncbi:MAG: alpha/beta hydrolase, partial [Gemmatimonadetes bacterium]|nr:alpha/beta hydrolase [Gemmatimonadota bacterium]
PVVLLLGWEGRGTQLGRLGEPLIAAGHRVLALDGPAHGRSAGKRAHPIAFAEALLAVQGEVGRFHAVVAHSMGAASTAVAIRRGLHVERVALLGGPASLPEVLSRFIAVVGIEPRVARHLRERLAEITGAHPDEVDVRLTGPRMRVPALIVHDRHDAEVPVADGRVIADHWPRARYLEVDVGGHRRMLKAPEVIEAVAGFVGPAD